MTDLGRRKLLMGSALIAGAGLTGLLRPGQGAGQGAERLIENALPDRIAGWHRIALADFVLPPADALGRSQYDALVLRGYAGLDRQPLYCVITYGAVQDYALQLHRPEVCYPASGFRVRSLVPWQDPVGGRDLGATLMVADRDGQAETVLYWTRVGKSFPRSQWQVREAILGGITRFRLPDGAMVRLSTQGEPGPAINRQLGDFASALVQGMAPAGRSLLLGEPA